MAWVFRIAGALVALTATSAVLSGCMGPTYGTDKRANAQLIDDLGGTLSFGGTKPQPISYQPRGGLVKPVNDKELVAPQKSLANKDNPQWVESPEQARERLKMEADANKDNGSYRSPLMVPVTEGKALTPEQQAKAFREARKLQSGAYSDKRRFMSDPPLEYRKVDDPAALSNLGESEVAKQKRRQKEAAIAGTGRPWWKLFD
jgi:hypothetical protein